MPKANRTINSDAVVMKVNIANEQGQIPEWMVLGRVGSLAEKLNQQRRSTGKPLLTEDDRDALMNSIDRSGQTDISLDGSLLTALWLLAPKVQLEEDKASVKQDVVDLVESAAFEVAWNGTLGRSSFSRAVQAKLVEMIAELGGADLQEFQRTISDFRIGEWKFFQRRSYNERLAAHETCALRRTTSGVPLPERQSKSSKRRGL